MVANTFKKAVVLGMCGALTLGGLDTGALRIDTAYAEEDARAASPASAVRVVALPDDLPDNLAPITALDKPVIAGVVNTADAIEVMWEAVENADAYILERKDTNNTAWSALATLGGDARCYADTDIAAGVKYYYRLRAQNTSSEVFSLRSASVGLKRLEAPAEPTTTVEGDGVLVQWTPCVGASGYRVYRMVEGGADWELQAAVAGASAEGWVDTAMPNGSLCSYAVAAYSGSAESVRSTASSTRFLAAPAVKSLKRLSKTSYQATWKKNSKASGYQIQYSQSSLFASKKTVTIKKNATVKQKLKGLAKGKTYYVRVRAYLKKDGKTYYSAWSHSSNVRSTKSLALSVSKKKSKVFELRAQAKQAMYGYDTVQGGCTDGKYAYFCLYNRKVEKCKIAKVRLSNLKVTKVSKALSVAHGNDIAYDSQRKRLAVVHTTVNGKRISLISPSSLKVTKTVDVSVPKGLAGASDGQRKAVSGLCGIAYSKKRDQYAVLLGKSHDFLLLDGNLQPVRYCASGSKNGLVYQGIDATDDYIIVGQSRSDGGKPNYLLVYTWDGSYVATVRLKQGYELENVFHIGSKWYASFYRSYYKVSYVNQRKTVVANGKRKVVRERVRQSKLQRDNYLYRIKGL